MLLSPKFPVGIEGISLMGMLKALYKGGELLYGNFLILEVSSEYLLGFFANWVAIKSS